MKTYNNLNFNFSVNLERSLGKGLLLSGAGVVSCTLIAGATLHTLPITGTVSGIALMILGCGSLYHAAIRESKSLGLPKASRSLQESHETNQSLKKENVHLLISNQQQASLIYRTGKYLILLAGIGLALRALSNLPTAPKIPISSEPINPLPSNAFTDISKKISAQNLTCPLVTLEEIASTYIMNGVLSGAKVPISSEPMNPLHLNASTDIFSKRITAQNLSRPFVMSEKEITSRPSKYILNLNGALNGAILFITYFFSMRILQIIQNIQNPSPDPDSHTGLILGNPSSHSHRSPRIEALSTDGQQTNRAGSRSAFFQSTIWRERQNILDHMIEIFKYYNLPEGDKNEATLRKYSKDLKEYLPGFPRVIYEVEHGNFRPLIGLNQLSAAGMRLRNKDDIFKQIVHFSH